MRETSGRTWKRYLVLAWCGIWCGAALGGEAPWKKDSARWTANDVQHILYASPWAQSANATFPTPDRETPAQVAPLPGAREAGIAGARGVEDGHWDGGVGRMERGGPPTLPVMVRWDSALPVRQALRADGERRAEMPDLEKEAARSYIISVSGLAPGGRFSEAGRLETKSESEGAGHSGGELQDPEPMLEGLMANTSLEPRGRAPIRPSNARLDAKTGTLYLFFPRTAAIEVRDREVMFTTRFGSLTVEKRFLLKDMTLQGKLEL